MPDRQKTLTEFIIQEQRRFPEATGDFTALLNYVRLACKRISFLVGRGALEGTHGSAGATNVQGEAQQKLDVIANDIFLRTSEYGGNLAAMVSEEMEDVYAIPAGIPARQVPAGLRPARWFVQHRRQRLGRQHLLGPARARRRGNPHRRRFPAARHAAAVRRLRDLRPDDDAGADARPRRARVHARPRVSASSS